MEPVQPHEVPNNTSPLTNPLGDVTEVDWNTPNSARMYDYFLGGNANFEVDRQAARRVLELTPESSFYLRNNRAFLWRAVRWLARDAGIDQFLDLGSGIPTLGNVHEIAQQQSPNARVAYVDDEPIAVHHARQMLDDTEHRVTMTQADIRDPEAVLNAPGVIELLNWTRPVAVLAVGILPFLPELADIQQLVARYREATSPGSYLAITHISPISWDWDQIQAQLNEVMGRTATPEQVRTREAIAAMLPGYELVEPGLVPTVQWRPDHEPSTDDIGKSNCYAAVGYRR